MDCEGGQRSPLRRVGWLCCAGWRLRVDRPGGISAMGGVRPIVGPARPAGRRGLRRGLGQAGGGQPDRVVQGPDGNVDDRGRRGGRATAARADGRRVHRGQHRLVAGVRLRGEGLPAADRLVRRVRRREDPHDAGLRRRGRTGAQPRGHHAGPDPDDDESGPPRSRPRSVASQTDQFNNTDMVEGYRPLGQELARQLPAGSPRSAPTWVRPAASSATTRARLPPIHRVVVEPGESAVLSGGPPGTHHIEGGGIGRRPPQLHQRITTR